jgi:serine phosphatase RsbU (regulator of sigma subunit)
VISLVTNILFFQYNSSLNSQEILINGGFLVLTVGIISVVLIQSRYVLTKKEIIARLALAATNDQLEIQKSLIEVKNKEITDSINYAQRIQLAILPDKQEIYTSLPQSFALYKPKDIVSGDFYFFTKKHDTVFIAAVDCTGHGVPGAFMSMIASEKLNEAVDQSSDLSEILRLVNLGIKKSLKQSEQNDDSTRDGMDLALCTIDLKNKYVNFAGANRPFWLIKKGSEIVEEIKATKKAIGGFTEDDQLFERHEIALEDGDTFYLCTDGYADTFNGENGKKLTTKKLKEILLEIQDLSMSDQENYLDVFIEDWKSGTEQVDDILVIGVRL